MRQHSIIVAFLALTGTAYAADVPQSSRFDNRIQYVNYNPSDVVVIRSVAGIGTRIVFAPNETILDVASGFTQGWEFSDRRNILYIKAKSIKGEQGQPAMAPEPGKWDTNLMVTTNLRMYDLDLYLLPGSNNSGKAPSNQKISYRVEFKYPGDEAAAERSLADKQRTRSALDTKAEPRNWNYSMQIGDASENIAPTMAYDDGRFTYLKFPNNRDFPSAFLVAADKTESLVNSHIDPAFPDTLVLQRVSKEMVLRLGKAVVGVYNDSFDPDGIPAEGGTTVPGVKRILKSGENN
ncbi:MAG TPA: P-type conjugative transfer protein VirB9 [Oligoflexus sp.]|uniref:P-type conjugative transfer protein VirB9 n=1 Tax=Oligoflexus sp. TaxID=1971216 RepID=UPI002D7E20DD|nr:P-type conjugative transfer protein VirB9 [Oligoflexus sp.]HET9239200.1 P-type conjugative transfer protein VirB9 [Oligoflexus sp.]